ncbi:hypothetical protein [Pseudomonas aeruginosa]|uniref:hypothetical protein n=1 Tax=Pseudomonas aeruginosa TaxID=287 RepID=UPI000188FCCB|nr:hypothetical protein [Pseudomonas aeruginosa]AHC65158.1 hypothetical protein T223_12790 [Pseudomonas aeruginosa LES431]AHK82260.1 hypothetical protein T227_06885 [Pseudomonas aeruginosa LESlike5]AHK88160.1 hypothetical protein T228_06570 [Pseudomonas aeruginosa LESlike7]AHK95272.1 hypothetical protein T222_13120 [Pseudomonas aeruginosa LES400]AHL00104.1 hypothetical protein T224_06880 [Pseudomonas aeruginosa LESB65]
MLKHQEQTEVLAGLLSKTALARMAFALRIMAPAVAEPYQVVPQGRGFFHIIETATGAVRGFRRNHNDACAYAEHLKRQQAAK